MIMEKEKAMEALKNSDEFYLLTYTKGMKQGNWNFKDYAKLMGCLTIASEWFKKECLKSFK